MVDRFNHSRVGSTGSIVSSCCSGSPTLFLSSHVKCHSFVLYYCVSVVVFWSLVDEDVALIPLSRAVYKYHLQSSD